VHHIEDYSRTHALMKNVSDACFFSFTGTYVWVCSITSNASHPAWLLALIELPVPTYGYVVSHHIKVAVDRRRPKGPPARPSSFDRPFGL